MVTADDVRDMILREVGAGLLGLPDVVLAAALDKIAPFINVYWDMWTWKAPVWPGLQALYTKRSCLDILLGQTHDLMPQQIGPVGLQQQTIFNNLQTLRKNTNDEIIRVEAQAVASRSAGAAPTPLTQYFEMDQWNRATGRCVGAAGQPGKPFGTVGGAHLGTPWFGGG